MIRARVWRGWQRPSHAPNLPRSKIAKNRAEIRAPQQSLRAKARFECGWHSAFPAPSSIQRREMKRKARQILPRECYLKSRTSRFVIARLDRAIQYPAADVGPNKRAQGL